MPSRSQTKAVVMKQGSLQAFLMGLIAKATDAIYMEFREVAGAASADLSGFAHNGTIVGGVTLGQADNRGAANDAFLWDGDDSPAGGTGLITIPAAQTHQSAAKRSKLYLLRPDNIGEGSNGHLERDGNNVNSFVAITTVIGRIWVRIAAATTNGEVQANFANASAGEWSLFMVTYDDAGDRKPTVKRWENGAMAAASSFTTGPTAAVGTLSTITATARIIGNSLAADRTYGGAMAMYLDLSGYIVTDAEAAQLGNLLGLSGS